MNFAERVEQRAREIHRELQPVSCEKPWDDLDEDIIDDYLEEAHNQVILEWAAANQGAMEALVEGKAKVVYD